MPSVIKLIVADKQIGAVLRLVKPYALDPPVVDPMDDTPNSPAVKLNKGAATAGLISKHVAGLKVGTKITAREMSQLSQAGGGHANGYSYILKKLLLLKVLGRTKLPNTYEVLKNG